MSDTIEPVVRKLDDVTVVAFGEEAESIYEHQIETFKDDVLELARSTQPPKLVIELPETKYFGSAFLAFLLNVRKTLMLREKAQFAVCSLTPYCRTIVEMSQLNEIWDIYDSAEEAVRAFHEDQAD